MRQNSNVVNKNSHISEIPLYTTKLNWKIECNSRKHFITCNSKEQLILHHSFFVVKLNLKTKKLNEDMNQRQIKNKCLYFLRNTLYSPNFNNKRGFPSV